MRTYYAILLCALAVSAGALGQVDKQLTSTDAGDFELFWWPKLPAVKGWHRDQQTSRRYHMNVLVPDGQTFQNAESVMYATAFPKTRMPEVKSLQMFIDNDKKKLQQKNPKIQIKDDQPVPTGDGKKFSSVFYLPNGPGNMQRVAYAEEGEFYLTFVINSRSNATYQKGLASYREMVGRYKEKP